MVAVISRAKTPAGAAQEAAPAGPAAVNRTVQTLRLKHACLATACSDLSCKLCANSALRACSIDLKQKYVAGSGLQAPCGAWPVVELLGHQESDSCQSRKMAKFSLKVELIDELKYQQVDLADTAPTAEQLSGCLASDAGLKYKGTQGTTATIPFKEGTADLSGLHIYKVPGGRSGHSTFYRLLFTALIPKDDKSQSNTHTADTDSPAASLLTDKLLLVTTRSRSNEKSCVLQGSEPVKRVLAVGDGFAKILSSLKDHVPEVREGLAVVTKVKEFHQLVQWVKQTSNTRVPSLFRPNDWARASKHVLSALCVEDNQQRLWFPSAKGAGLLFDCQQGDPKLDSPAAFVLMLGGRLVIRSTSQLGSVQLQQLMQKAIRDWKAAGHPNWSVFGEAAAATAAAGVENAVTAGVGPSREADARIKDAKQSEGCCSSPDAAKASATSKPTAILARAAVAAAFGRSSAGGGSRQTNISSRAEARASQGPAATSAAAAVTPAVIAADKGKADTVAVDDNRKDGNGTAVSGPAVSLKDARSAPAVTGGKQRTAAAARAATAIDSLAAAATDVDGGLCSKLTVSLIESRMGEPPPAAASKIIDSAGTSHVSAAAAIAILAEAAVAPVTPSSKRQQQGDNTTEQPPTKKMCITAEPGTDEVIQSLAAMDAEEDYAVELEHCSVFEDWCMKGLDAHDLSDDLCSCSSFWQELEQQQQSVSDDVEEESDLQQLMLSTEDEAADLQRVYEYMCKEWCGECDVELGNNLGDGFLCELQQMQHSLENELQQNQKQQQGGGVKHAGCACDLEVTVSRLLSLSDLPDVLEGCGATDNAWAQALDELPAVVI